MVRNIIFFYLVRRVSSRVLIPPPYIKQKTLEDENNELKHKSNELPRCNQR